MERLRIKSEAIREFLAELLGTFVLTAIGCSSNAYVVVAKEAQIGHIVGAFSWGMALAAAIYVCGGVSGGHVNPAVTIGMASIGKLNWGKVVHYIIAQYIGAFLGAVVTFLVYREAINEVFLHDAYNLNTTAGIFGTFPNANVGAGTCIIDQVVAVGFFLLLINAITDEKNIGCAKGLVPIAIGITDLGLMVFAFGYNCGAPINPARDFAPRLFTAMAGWGRDVFSVMNYNYFWIPIIGCHIGGILGSWMYWLLIENHLPQGSYDLYNYDK